MRAVATATSRTGKTVIKGRFTLTPRLQGFRRRAISLRKPFKRVLVEQVLADVVHETTVPVLNTKCRFHERPSSLLLVRRAAEQRTPAIGAAHSFCR